MNINNIPQIKHIDSGNFFLLAGPCAIEGEEMALKIAEKLIAITDKLEIPYVFKGSFKKANRSRIDSFSGIGDEKALKILRKVSETFYVPTVTDKSTSASVEIVCVPATAASTISEMALLTAPPHCPDSVPVAGRRRPISDVFAIYSSYCVEICVQPGDSVLLTAVQPGVCGLLIFCQFAVSVSSITSHK
jgi:hypothetical protein